MSYKVVYPFYDTTDKDHVYNVGDEYPRAGSKPKEDRVKELAGDYNKLQRPLIKELVEEEAENQEPNTEEPNVEELRERAKELGIEVKGNWGVPRLTEEIEKAEAK